MGQAAVLRDHRLYDSNQWINRGVDGYFLASDITRAAMVARGACRSILHVTGIPVKLEIADPSRPRRCARATVCRPARR